MLDKMQAQQHYTPSGTTVIYYFKVADGSIMKLELRKDGMRASIIGPGPDGEIQGPAVLKLGQYNQE
jgi:hypothetical protein